MHELPVARSHVRLGESRARVLTSSSEKMSLRLLGEHGRPSREKFVATKKARRLHALRTTAPTSAPCTTLRVHSQPCRTSSSSAKREVARRSRGGAMKALATS